MNLKIQVDNRKARYGFIKGKIGSYNWFALVQKETVNYGINPETLERGEGKIVRLCIYRDTVGNRDKDAIKRLIYANYTREWDVFSDQHKNLVKGLVDYLQRRYSLKLVK